MPSRRRRRSKNLGTNLADVQRRLRYLERRPVRTKLQRNVVTTSAIAVNAVGPDEVSFGTTVITDAAVNTIENPKDGLLVINETSGVTSVYSAEQETYLQLPAVDDTARATADGKNTIYRQNNAPTGATYTAGDLWYDQDDGNKMYRYTGSAWSEAVVLGTNAVANLNASVITAGEINANTISLINLNAANISTGDLAAARIATTALNANNITAGTITGVTFQTSTVGVGNDRAIRITNSDDILFFNDADEIGILTVINQNAGGGGADDTWSFNDGVVMAGLEGTPPAQGSVSYPFVGAAGSGNTGVAGLFGDQNNFIIAEYVAGGGISIQGNVLTGGNSFRSLADLVDLASGWGQTDGVEWRVEINGPLILGENSQGPLLQGNGAPSAADGFATGQICFRYT